MSEDRDIPEGAVDHEFETAEQMLADARIAHEVGISKATVVNRLYYACFHAAQGALYAHGVDPQSHGHVQTLLGKEFIREDSLDRKWGRFLNDMETYRRRVDYGSGSVERESEELLEATADFLDAMAVIRTLGADD